jgi:hypothetical protein
MLGIKKYSSQYINQCQNAIESHLSNWNIIKLTLKEDDILRAFEIQFFNNLVLVLDYYFVHRLRVLELKDGNPLNEVRMIADSLLNNNGLFAVDKTITYKINKSILNLELGDNIKLTQEEFELINAAFFKDLEKKYL